MTNQLWETANALERIGPAPALAINLPQTISMLPMIASHRKFSSL